MVPIGFRASFSCMIAVMEAVVVEEHEWSALQVHKAKSPYKLMRRKSEAILMLSEGVGVDVITPAGCCQGNGAGARPGVRRHDGTDPWPVQIGRAHV